MPDVWEVGYRVSDGPRRTRVAYSMLWPYVRRSLNRLLAEHPCSLIVSVHQLINTPVSRAAAKYHTPFATVVTDLVSTHAAWYCTHADMVVVPTRIAYQRGLMLGLKAEQMRIVGLPVADRFCQPAGTKMNCARIGLAQRSARCGSGGRRRGMGPLAAVAKAINQQYMPMQLIVIADGITSSKSSWNACSGTCGQDLWVCSGYARFHARGRYADYQSRARNHL